MLSPALADPNPHPPLQHELRQRKYDCHRWIAGCGTAVVRQPISNWTV
jgi:hypothetical protein